MSLTLVWKGKAYRGTGPKQANRISVTHESCIMKHWGHSFTTLNMFKKPRHPHPHNSNEGWATNAILVNDVHIPKNNNENVPDVGRVRDLESQVMNKREAI